MVNLKNLVTFIVIVLFIAFLLDDKIILKIKLNLLKILNVRVGMGWKSIHL